MSPESRKILVIGFGNPGRLDDGLGPAFAEIIAELGLETVTVDSDYQLTVETAAQLRDYDIVIFADASVSDKEPFEFSSLPPQFDGAAGFSSHKISPGEVLGLAQELFDCTPDAYMLSIRGYDYNEFGEGLSGRAKRNLDEAVDFASRWLFLHSSASLGCMAV